MSRPPHARQRVLDAFEQLLIDDGERAATMEAVARAAGVSKGGLIYHFPSKTAMEQGLVDHLDEVARDDVAAMLADPAGPVAAFIRTSTTASNPALDRAITATTRLAGNGSEIATAGLAQVRSRWREMLRPHVRDETALTLVLLVSDGIYFSGALNAAGTVESLDELIDLLLTAVAPAA